MGLAVDHQHQRGPAPALGQRLGDVPAPLLDRLDLLQQQRMVAPRQLPQQAVGGGFRHGLWRRRPAETFRHSLWRKLPRLRIGPREGQHAVQVAAREALELRQLVAQIVGQARDDAGAPPFGRLALVEQPADAPVQPDQLGIDGQHRPRLRGLDARLDVGEQLGVVGQFAGHGASRRTRRNGRSTAGHRSRRSPAGLRFNQHRAARPPTTPACR